jgi:hypothetical protein
MTNEAGQTYFINAEGQKQIIDKEAYEEIKEDKYNDVQRLLCLI